MEAFIGTLLLCIIPGMLAAAGYCYDLNNKKLKYKKVSKIVMFFLLLYYGVLAGVKSILGEAELTLIESFKDIEGKTYLHYALPLLLIGVLFVILLKYLDASHKVESFIELLDSVWLFILLIIYPIIGKISNWLYLCLGSISILITFFIFYKYNIRFDTNNEYKIRIKCALPIALFWIFSSILYFPSELFLTNISEFPMHYSVFISILLAQSIITLTIYVLVSTLFFTNNQFELFYTGLFSVTFTGYVQALFFNGRLYSLDGSKQGWGGGKIGINLILWALILSLIFLFKWKQKEKVGMVYRIICICFCLMQMVVVFNLIFSAKGLNENDHALTQDGFFDLHEDNNVLVFILDFFDSQIIEQILEQDENFLTPLCGFTYYPNTTSRYAFTNESVPYLLTGVEAENVSQFSLFQYTEYAFENSTFLNDIAGQGYEIGIYTEAHYLGENVKGIISNYEENIDKDYDIENIISLMSQSSKYKMAPFALKNIYCYDSGEVEKLAVKKNVYSTIDDLALYQDLCQSGLKIDADMEGKGAFRFYHMYGAHSPYKMTDELKELDSDSSTTAKEQMISQAKGSLKIVYEYIKQLKELGLYDNATIIITSDHGQNYLLEAERVKLAEELDFQGTSNPILFVKTAGQKDDRELAVSTAPLSHADLHATIIRACQGDSNMYGKAIDDYHEGEERERKFLYGRRDIPYREFTIRGDVRDINNWYLTYTDKK